ncbi:S41 family peptidase [Candidatus Parcubacteria bacterium]|nr:PDZ domain-containing protein [Patescibacteria group bacterium]MCG2694284.1 S41 family peptidase [Candidatus Parcubacteria bacterium]
MCKIAILFVILFSGCGMFGPPKIGSGKPIKEVFAIEATLNPSSKCSFLMLYRAFSEINKSYYKKVSKKEVFEGGLKGLSKELGTELVLPEFEKDDEYTSDKLWRTIIDARDKSKKSLSQLCYATVQGAVSNLGDRFSIFIPAKNSKDFVRGVLGGSYFGIGAVFQIFVEPEQRVFIRTVHHSSPAERAGLKDYDELIAVEDVVIKKLNIKRANEYSKVVSLIKGKNGKPVYLTVNRKGWKHPRKIKVIRGKVKNKEANCKLLGKIVYCRVFNFGERMMKDFKESFEALSKEHDNKVVIDLRNNLGGLLYQATGLLAYGWFNARFSAAVIKSREQFTMLISEGGEARLRGYKTVILVNHTSASASEIVAGALQDHGKAVLIGTKTFGKGTVQALMPVLGAALNLTVREYWTPLGDIVNKKGITPDIEVLKDIADFINARDPQLGTAIKYLNK